MRARGVFALAVGLLAAAGPSAAGPQGPRVLSLDQCADQYVLALSPRSAIVGLSPRARNADSLYAAAAAGLPVRRADREAVLGAGPQVVVRYWGGDAGLVRLLGRRGVRVVRIEDAVDFAGVRANIRRVAVALGRQGAGEALIAGMDERLARSRGAWGGRPALYLTAGGATAGPGTLVDRVMAAAGLSNAEIRPGFHQVSLERLARNPPRAVVEGFFDPGSGEARWAPARHAAFRRLTRGRTLVSLPGALLGCPAWFAADAAALIAAAAPQCRRPGGAGPLQCA